MRFPLLPAPVVPMSEVELIDHAAMAIGQDLGSLMERAGAALADAAGRMETSNGIILIATGPGNNGGDGWVAARLLHQQGRTVQVWPVCPPRTDLCRQQAEAATAAGVPVVAGPEGRLGLIIDAILGAGSVGRPRDPIPAAIHALSRSGAPVLAADVPTGLGSDCLLPATLTLCFQVAKRELLNDPRVREFRTVDIGLRPEAYLVISDRIMRRFPALWRDGHKGQHGELLVMGGGVFPGALEMACRAAMYTGVDLVRAWTSDGPPLPYWITSHRQPGRCLGPDEPGRLTAVLVRAAAVLIGPGLGREEATLAAARQMFGLAYEMGVPLIIDADGLACLASILRDLPPGQTPILLTPHRGEARNLLGTTPDERLIHEFARPDRQVILKAPIDLVTDGSRWQLNPRGNPRMAVGGTGDCLAGLAAGLIARGLPPFDAARLALVWLCEAAELAWQALGPCYTPEDIYPRLPEVLRRHLEPIGAWPPVRPHSG